MELTTDAYLKGPIWAETIDRLVGSLFKTNWDIYALSITIGIMYDAQIEPEDMVPQGYEGEPRYVPRTILGHTQNKALIEFMLQASMITTKHIDLNEDERLEVAFNDDKKYEFNPIAFLTKFANYGITKIHKVINGCDDIEMLESLMRFLNTTYESGICELNDYFDLYEIDD